MSIPTPSAPIADHADRRNLRFTRLYYFLFYGGSGFMTPFLSLFYVQQGLSGTQIGWVTSIGAAVTLVAAPIWAHRNAHWRNPRGMLQLFLVLTALSFLWISQQTLFWGIAVGAIFRALVGAGISPLSDSLALTITRITRAGFGSIRVWGSAGWTVFVLMSGALVQQTGLRTSLLGAFVITSLAALILFPIGSENFSVKKMQDEIEPRFRVVIAGLARNRTMIGLAVMIVFVGVAGSGVGQFENVYLRQLGAPDTLIAVIGMLSAVVEIPCMFLADRLTSRRGPYTLLMLSMLAFLGVRLGVLLVPTIPVFIGTELASGVAFSFYTVGLVRFISEQTTPHETRTVLALFNITLVNLINIVSAPFAGMVFDAFGARWVYLIAVIGYFLAWGSLYISRPRTATQIGA